VSISRIEKVRRQLSGLSASTLALPIQSVEITPITRARLQEAGVASIGDLRRFSDAELMRLRGIGRGRLEQVFLAVSALLDAEGGSPTTPHQSALMLGPPSPSSFRRVLMSAPDLLLKLPLARLGISKRASGALQRLGIERVEDLVGLSEAEVRNCQGFGETSFQEVSSRLQLLTALEEPALLAATADTSLETTYLLDGIADRVRHVRLRQLMLPSRVVSRLAVQGINRVIDLAAYSRADLLRVKGLGPGGAEALLGALKRLNEQPIETVAAAVGDESLSFQGLLDEFIEGLHQRSRGILALRMGLAGSPQTLEEVGSSLNLTRERVRQIQSKTLQLLLSDGTLLKILRTVLERLLSSRSRPLYAAALAMEDPWFIGAKSVDRSVPFLVDNLLYRHLHTIRIGGAKVIARVDEDAWERKRRASRAFIETSVDKRLSESMVKLAIASFAGTEAAELRGELWTYACANALFALPAGESEPILVADGRGMEHRVKWVLECAEAPMHYSEIARVIAERFGEVDERQVLNAAATVGVLLHRGTYGSWRHVGLTDAEALYVASLCEGVVEDGQSSRQWHSTEFIELLREQEVLFQRLTHFSLSAVLRRFSALHYVGRQAWIAERIGRGGGHARLEVMSAVESVLDDEGKPLSAQEIHRRVRAIRGLGLHFQIHPRGRLIKLGPSLWGLKERDLYMPSDELAAALSFLDKELRRRNSALHLSEISELVGSDVDVWQVYGPAQIDPRFRVSAGDLLFLSEWEGPRRETIPEAIRAVALSLPREGLTTDEIAAAASRRSGRVVSLDYVRWTMRTSGVSFSREGTVWLSREHLGVAESGADYLDDE
jgi:DNA-directed RNA polymerase alpha subunit